MGKNSKGMPSPGSVKAEEKVIVEEKSSIPNTDAKSDSVKKFETPKSGIKVKALRKGFYRNSRKKAGDEFLVACFEELGSWMQPEDKKLADELKKYLKDKVAAARAK